VKVFFFVEQELKNESAAAVSKKNVINLMTRPVKKRYDDCLNVVKSID